MLVYLSWDTPRKNMGFCEQLFQLLTYYFSPTTDCNFCDRVLDVNLNLSRQTTPSNRRTTDSEAYSFMELTETPVRGYFTVCKLCY